MSDHENELFTQDGMTRSLTRFAEILRSDPNRGFCSMLAPVFLRCCWDEATMVYTYPTEPWMRNPSGNIHGGILASMVDTTMGAMTYYMSGEKITPTITMKVDYVSPGQMGLPIYAGVKCTRCGRTMGYVTCKMWQTDENKPIVTADGVYYTAGPKFIPEGGTEHA